MVENKYMFNDDPPVTINNIISARECPIVIFVSTCVLYDPILITSATIFRKVRVYQRRMMYDNYLYMYL